MRHLFMVAYLSLASCSLALAEEAQDRFTFIDLQPKANQVLKETFSQNFPDAHLADLPQGEQKLGTAPFKIGPGCICLGSTLQAAKPEKVEIPVKRKLARLFILHATQNGGFPEPHPTHVKDGTLIGQYMVRYADGSGEGIEITYGEDVRDWWNWDKSKETKRGKATWTGTNPAAKMHDVDVRLYESSWTNPKPDLEIASITYSSRMDTPGAPFCVALTTEAIAAKAGQGKPLQPQQLLGAWVLVGKPGAVIEPEPGARLKFMGAHHWVITQADANTGRVIWHHGGTYTLDGNKLVEKVLYANESTGSLVGKEFHFTLTLDGDTLTWLGDDNPWSSVWKRPQK